MTQKRRRKTVRDGARERPPIEKAPAEKPPVVTATPEDVAREVGAAPERPSSDGVCELEDRLRRVQADFVNDLKRIERQADDRARYAVEGLLTDLLPVFDALHSAREGFASRVEADGEADDTARAALEGFDLVERELLATLGRHGAARIEAVGVPFDHGLHHAIVMVDRPDLEPGTVAMELRPGFTLNGRVVRPAHVAVVAERPAKTDEAQEGAGGNEPETRES